ncbi:MULTISPECIES: glycosyltransferase [unclassified Rubrivivax]|uniref:glycosyltransferase n=1 Tax=unclassified Rubrivivax TaxID=2649762 RepID=UPI001E36C169|nr:MULTISPECIES: glycosyltransferase [unclassified Rubrivivax]MCC9597110.1 glycosyltransferase [Rubrivivax sp. JA1055]MCC9646631.1 glycosyltransferase [Rubrivivax sp. JA1029]
MVIVLTYGKVCTTSLRHLLGDSFPGRLFFSHGLGRWIVDPLEGFIAAAATDTSGLRSSFDNRAIREQLDLARAAGETVTIISGVRDPVARSLSVAIQNLEAAFADCRSPSAEATAEAVAARVADLWLRDTPDGDPARLFLERMIRAPHLWFEEELEKPFGFDLQAQPFDRERGYSVQTRDGVRLLLFRHENAPEAIEAGLAELFPGQDMVLPHDNANSTKPTGEVYRALQDCFRLPRPALEAIYAHPHVSAYYSPAEISAAIDRWAEPAPSRTWVMPPPPAAPRQVFAATVFIPLRNHAEWIGPLLDSLFAQWRSDTELVLVDDGSQDGSLGIVMDRLSGRPEVAATVMRNPTAIGHGMLPAVAALSRAPLLIQADSDDIALPGRLDTIVGHFAAHPDCRLLTSNAVLMSEGGIPIGLLDTQLPDAVISDPVQLVEQQTQPYWLGATSAYHRSILEAFPPIDVELCPYGLDLLTGFRATLLGCQHYLARPLVGWRQHSRNSHRAIGTGRGDDVGREHLAAVRVMVRAQRLRDVAWLSAQGQLDPARAAEIEARWQADHLATTEAWIRSRNHLTGTHAAPVPRAAGAPAQAVVEETYIPPVPPIVTLPRGFECPVEQMNDALSRWPGIHPDCGLFVWTSRQAAVVLRIPDPESQALVVTLAGLPYIDRQTVSLSLDFAPPVEATLIAGHARRVTLPIAARRGTTGGLVTLMICVPSAASHAAFNPASNDARVLGAALLALQVI